MNPQRGGRFTFDRELNLYLRRPHTTPTLSSMLLSRAIVIGFLEENCNSMPSLITLLPEEATESKPAAARPMNIRTQRTKQ